MKVDIIIPNYNGSHLIKNSIYKVLNSLDGYEGRLIIVDDGSKESDRSSLKQIIEQANNKNKHEIKYVEHKKNLGFSSAVNTGVKASDADYVVLLNSDVIPSTDFLKNPLELLRNDKKLFALGCMDESIEGTKSVFRGRGIGFWENGMLNHKRGEVDRNDTFWVSGGSSIYRRDIYSSLGGMDEVYNPFYWEDIDLSYRAQKAGYKIYFDQKSRVKHYHEEGAIKKNYEKNKVTTVAYRNQLIFIWKNITDRKIMLNHLLYLPKNILGTLKRKDFNFIKGLGAALLKLPYIIKKRIQFNKHICVSDREIIKEITW